MKTQLSALVLSALAISCAPTRVERHGWVTGLKPEKAATYRKLHANPWPAVNAMLKECHIRNFSIYEREIGGKTYLFAYLEYTGSNFDADMKKMAASEAMRKWWDIMEPMQDPIPTRQPGEWWARMDEVFHTD